MAIILGRTGMKIFRSPVYSLTGSVSSVNEGETVTFTLTTDGPDGTFYWTNSGTTVGADFTDSANSGSFMTAGGVGSFSRSLREDAAFEGSESIIMQARTAGYSGTVVATSQVVTVNDTSFTPPGRSPDWTVGTGGNFATLEAALASPSVTDGHYIKLLPGTHYITGTVPFAGYGNVGLAGAQFGKQITSNRYSASVEINKKVYIAGTPGVPSAAVIQTVGERDVGLLISADDVLLKDITVKVARSPSGRAVLVTRKPTMAGGANGIVLGGVVKNFMMDNCRVEFESFNALGMWGDTFKIANCTFAQTGSATGHTYIAVHNATTVGTSSAAYNQVNLFKNNVFENAGGVGSKIFCFTRSDYGSISGGAGRIPGTVEGVEVTFSGVPASLQRFGGRTVIDGSSWNNIGGDRPDTFFLQDHFSGSSAGTFGAGAYFPVFKNNIFDESPLPTNTNSGFIILRGFEDKFANGIGAMLVDNNTLSNRHGKGMITVDRRLLDWNSNNVPSTEVNFRSITGQGYSFNTYIGTNIISASSYSSGFASARDVSVANPASSPDFGYAVAKIQSDKSSPGEQPVWYYKQPAASASYIASSSFGVTSDNPFYKVAYSTSYTEPATPHLA